MNNKTINPSGTFMFDVVVLRRVTQGPPKSSVCYVYYHYEYFFLPFVKPNGFILYCSVIKNYLDLKTPNLIHYLMYKHTYYFFFRHKSAVLENLLLTHCPYMFLF
jgi:hypothetical protein